MALELYEELALRSSRDLDLLVRREDLPIILEIHWKLVRDYHPETPFDQLRQRKRIIQIAKQPICYLGKEDLFLFLISHGAIHAWFRLHWLGDMDRMLRKDLDWTACRHRLEQRQMQLLVGQALFLAQRFYDSPIPDELQSLLHQGKVNQLSRMAIHMINKAEYPSADTIFSRDYYIKRYYDYLLNTSFTRKCKYLLKLLYPHKEDMQTMPLPHSLWRLYVVVKPFLWLWRHTKNRFVKHG